MILDALETWNNFLQKIGDFFMTPDATGVNYLTRIIIAIILIVIGWILIRILMAIIKRAMGIRKKGPDIDVSAKFFIAEIIKIILWILLSFLVIATLKIDITGVAGVASAITVALGLALQDLIACFAYGVLILQQKNFVTGDFICVQNAFGSCEGTVSKVHFFFTFLNTPNGQEVTIPNLNVAKAVVTNYTRLGKRRVNYDVGVAYDTDISVAKKALMDIALDDPRVIKDGSLQVYVYELGAYSVGLRIRCWTRVDDYWPFYNDLSEKVLNSFRVNGIYIPSSTDISVSQKEK